MPTKSTYSYEARAPVPDEKVHELRISKLLVVLSYIEVKKLEHDYFIMSAVAFTLLWEKKITD